MKNISHLLLPCSYAMITIISCTNRPGSKTAAVAKHYHRLLELAGELSQILSLESLPHNFAFADLYDKRSPEMQAIVSTYIEQAEKFVFIIPEYNGSFPGVLKTFIDGIHPRNFRDKKAAIVGLSDGRAGNLRGQEHLTGILHYLKMHVHYSKPKLSLIDDLLNEHEQVVDEQTIKLLKEHAQAVMKF
ncbi:MAG: NADPH-dependent FMN reductase [Flavobacteriales bacterium]